MAGMDWFRWHHGSVTDPKFQLIARKTKSRVSDVIAVWAFLLEAASQADERGNPGAQDFEAIDCALGLDDGQAEAIHASMIDRGIVEFGGVIAKWETRQPKREREGDSSTERSRASRARKNQQEPQEANHDVATPCNTMQHQETPRVEKSREEKKKDIKTSASATPCPGDVGEQVWGDWVQLRKAKRATVSPTVIAEARIEAGKAGLTLERFFSVWCARGSQGLMADWLKPNERGSVAESGETTYQRSMRLKYEEATGTGQSRNVIDITPINTLELAS